MENFRKWRDAAEEEMSASEMSRGMVSNNELVKALMAIRGSPEATQLREHLVARLAMPPGRRRAAARRFQAKERAAMIQEKVNRDRDHEEAVRKKFTAAAHRLKLLPSWLLAVFEEDLLEDLIATAKEDGPAAAWFQFGLLFLKFGLHRMHRSRAKSSGSDKA